MGDKRFTPINTFWFAFKQIFFLSACSQTWNLFWSFQVLTDKRDFIGNRYLFSFLTQIREKAGGGCGGVWLEWFGFVVLGFGFFFDWGFLACLGFLFWGLVIWGFFVTQLWALSSQWYNLQPLRECYAGLIPKGRAHLAWKVLKNTICSWKILYVLFLICMTAGQHQLTSWLVCAVILRHLSFRLNYSVGQTEKFMSWN